MFDSSSEINGKTPHVSRLISKARQASRKTTRECAAALGIPLKRFTRLESGQEIPSLPEVEMLAYYFELPTHAFLSEEEQEFADTKASPEQIAQLILLRQRILSATLQLARANKKFSLKQLSSQTGIPAARIKRYELTAKPIPLNELQALCTALDIQLDKLMDQSSFAAEVQKSRQAKEHYQALPQEIKDFISDAANLPFLKLAMRLQQTGVENIESLAQGLQQLAEQVKE